MVVTLVIVVVTLVIVTGLDRERGEVDDVTVGVDDPGLLHDVGQRLAAAHLGDRHRHLTGVDQLLGELVGRHAVARCLRHQPRRQLGLGHGELLCLSDLVEHDLALERVASLLRELGAVLVVAVTIGEVVVDLLLDRGLRQWEVDGLEERVAHLLACGVALLEQLDAGDALGDVGLELVEGVELARELGEGVVGVGELALAHLGDDDGHLEGLVGELAALRGEGERAGLAGRSTLDSLVEAGEHAVGAELVGHRGADEVLDRLPVIGARDVDEKDVTRGGGALDRGEGAEAGAEGVELLGDVVVTHGRRVDRHLDRVVRRKLELGHDVHLGGELEGRGVLVGRDVDLGAAEQADVVLAQRGVEIGVERVVDGLVEDSSAADPLVDDAGGHLALAEAGHRDLVRDALVGGVKRRLQLLKRHLDGELHPGGREGLDSALHGDRYSRLVARPGGRAFVGSAGRTSRPGPRAHGMHEARADRSRGPLVGAGRLELPISCPQSRRARHYATPRGAWVILGETGTALFRQPGDHDSATPRTCGIMGPLRTRV